MNILDHLDLSQTLRSKTQYRKTLLKYQLSLLRQQMQMRKTRNSLILVFEGSDASGKGGTIKRFTEQLDARYVRVYSTLKPTDEEYRHHYLQRFWSKTPPYGETSVFDRSWYGRVLVERVEGFASTKEWQRAFEEINNFEKTLIDDGAIMIKFYLSISKKEQLKRFKKRQSDPYKHWKMSTEDWRNRRKWDQHMEAFEELYKKTNTSYAPWNLIEAECKRFARLKILETIKKTLSKKLPAK